MSEFFYVLLPAPKVDAKPSHLTNYAPSQPTETYDWTGCDRGRGFSIPACIEACSTAAVAPGGRLVLLDAGQFANARTGKPVARAPHEFYPGTWSDDGRYACGQGDGGQVPYLSLGFARVAGATHVVYPHVAGDWYVAACSPTYDRAILTTSPVDSVTAAVLVQLSTGQVLHTIRFPPPGPQNLAGANLREVIASPDARYLASWVHHVGGQGQYSSAADPDRNLAPTVIRDMLTGHVITQLSDGVVIAFSGDDSRAVIASGLESGAGGYAQPDAMTRVINWRSGATLFTRSGAAQFAVSRPASADFVLSLSPSFGHHFAVQTWLVRADAQTLKIPGDLGFVR